MPDQGSVEVSLRATRRPRPTALVVGALAVAVAGVVGVALLLDGPGGTDPSDTSAGGAAAAAGVGTTPGSSSTAEETPAAIDEETPAPAADTNGVQHCSGAVASGGTPLTVVGQDGEPTQLGGLEGWWNGTPVSSAGGWLPVERWPQQVLDHPATATVETTTRTVIETFDRRTCTGVPDYVPPDLSWFASPTVVVLDAETGEVLAEQAVDLVAP